MQTSSGPSIVLQGLHGYSLTPQQLALVQHQVKQQLLKGKLVHTENRSQRPLLVIQAFIDCTFTAQESTGKQGMLGPRKMYLAVQPAGGAPPPLTPVGPLAAAGAGSVHSIQSLQPLPVPTHQVIYYY